ncbi:MAG: type II toxin-antitoxin system PemK/MazF family toxin [Persicimonas sp.]
MSQSTIRLGDIWFADLEPVRGHEQGRKRPVLVVSKDSFNQLPLGLVWTVPLTTTQKSFPDWVPVAPPEGGLDRPSNIICSQLRCLCTGRLQNRLGAVSQQTLEQAGAIIKRILV